MRQKHCQTLFNTLKKTVFNNKQTVKNTDLKITQLPSRTVGLYKYNENTAYIDKNILKLGPETVEQILLHELVHAHTYNKHGHTPSHGTKWQQKMEQLNQPATPTIKLTPRQIIKAFGLKKFITTLPLIKKLVGNNPDNTEFADQHL